MPASHKRDRWNSNLFRCGFFIDFSMGDFTSIISDQMKLYDCLQVHHEVVLSLLQIFFNFRTACLQLFNNVIDLFQLFCNAMFFQIDFVENIRSKKYRSLCSRKQTRDLVFLILFGCSNLLLFVKVQVTTNPFSWILVYAIGNKVPCYVPAPHVFRVLSSLHFSGLIYCRNSIERFAKVFLFSIFQQLKEFIVFVD